MIDPIGLGMKYLPIGCLVFLFGSAFCQANSGDSLDYHIETAQSPAQKVILLNKASASLTDANLNRSLDYATRAYALAQQTYDETGLVIALHNLGKCYTRLGRGETAMENFLQALEISQKMADEKLVGQTYKLIGNSYYFRDETAMALQYYKRALLVNKKIKDEETEADLKNNIALVYLSIIKLDSALVNLTESAAAYERLNKPGKLANSLLNIGEVKARSQLYDEAIEYYKRALDINQSTGLTLQEGFALNNIAGSLISLKKYTEAEEYGTQALDIALKEKFQPLLLNVYQNMYRLNKENNNFSVALGYHEKLLKAKDTLFTAQKNKQMEELRAKYESEQKERENRSLIQESQLREKQLNVTRSLLLFIAIFAVIATVLAVIYFKSLVKNRRANAELLELNKHIQEQKEEISAQAEELSKVNLEVAAINQNLEEMVLEKTYKIVEQNEKLIEYTFQNSHQVRGPLARILGLLDLIKLGMVKPEEMDSVLNEIRKASDELDNVVKRINEILEQGNKLKI